jgi:cell wall-associated NlpC family hydrolase
MTISRRALLRAALVAPLAVAAVSVAEPFTAFADTGSGVGALDVPGVGVVAPGVPVAFPTGPGDNPIVASSAQALSSLNARDYNGYRERLLDVASAVGHRTGLSADDLATVWLRTDGVRMRVLLSGLTQVGVPYRFNASSPGHAFDCSGFVAWAWDSVGRGLPHQSRSIINSVNGSSVDRVQPGDVIYYPGHIMMALGLGTAMVHAPQTGRTVEVRASTSHRRMRVGSPA